MTTVAWKKKVRLTHLDFKKETLLDHLEKNKYNVLHTKKRENYHHTSQEKHYTKYLNKYQQLVYRSPQSLGKILQFYTIFVLLSETTSMRTKSCGWLVSFKEQQICYFFCNASCFHILCVSKMGNSTFSREFPRFCLPHACRTSPFLLSGSICPYRRMAQFALKVQERPRHFISLSWESTAPSGLDISSFPGFFKSPRQTFLQHSLPHPPPQCASFPAFCSEWFMERCECIYSFFCLQVQTEGRFRFTFSSRQDSSNFPRNSLQPTAYDTERVYSRRLLRQHDTIPQYSDIGASSISRKKTISPMTTPKSLQLGSLCLQIIHTGCTGWEGGCFSAALCQL